MEDDDFCTVQERRCRGPWRRSLWNIEHRLPCFSRGELLSHQVTFKVFPAPLHLPYFFYFFLSQALSLWSCNAFTSLLCSSPCSGMRKSPDVSPRRLSDISPQLRQLKYLVVDEAIKEDLKSSRSVEDINSASIEERILRITGYYGYQPWNASYKSESICTHGCCERLCNVSRSCPHNQAVSHRYTYHTNTQVTWGIHDYSDGIKKCSLSSLDAWFSLIAWFMWVDGLNTPFVSIKWIMFLC